jgi:four helix bundle protein
MNYENLDVWKLSRALAIDVYKTTTTIRDFGFKDQITRSALSVPSNIAEGFEKDYDKEKTRYLSIAKGSLGEFKTQADIGSEVGFIEKKHADFWMAESEKIARMIGALIKKINN